MSSKNNVNKDHYTQAGRDRPNENIVHSDHKEDMTRSEKRVATGEAALPRGKRVKSRAEQPPMVIGVDEAQIPPVSRADEDDDQEAAEREAGA